MGRQENCTKQHTSPMHTCSFSNIIIHPFLPIPLPFTFRQKFKTALRTFLTRQKQKLLAIILHARLWCSQKLGNTLQLFFKNSPINIRKSEKDDMISCKFLGGEIIAVFLYSYRIKGPLKESIQINNVRQIIKC